MYCRSRPHTIYCIITTPPPDKMYVPSYILLMVYFTTFRQNEDNWNGPTSPYLLSMSENMKITWSFTELHVKFGSEMIQILKAQHLVLYSQ